MRSFGRMVVAAALMAVCAFASAFDTTTNPTDSSIAALVAAGSADSTFYECRPQHYNPPCMKISRIVDTAGELTLSRSTEFSDYLQVRAAVEASILLIPIQIPDAPSDPTAACANTHGGSACCRIVHERTDSTGPVYVVECGNRVLEFRRTPLF